MQLHQLSFSLAMMKERLSEDEIVFFVQISQFLQEIMILQKCTIYAANEMKENGVEQTAQRIQALFFIKQLAGKLNEGWEMLQQSYFGQAISKEYHGLLSSDGHKRLDYIKRYFNRANNLVRTIRHEYAFHYGRERIQKHVDQFPQDESLCFIFSEELVNRLYVFSDDIVHHSLLDMIDPEDHQKAMHRLLHEIVREVCKTFQEVGHDLVLVILEKINPPCEQGEPIEISDPPDIKDVTLPYFVTR